MKLSKISSLGVVIFGICNFSANSTERTSKSYFAIKIADQELRSFQIDHSVDGYEINCKKTRAMIWGKPNRFSSNSPQDSIITLIDLKNRRKIFAKTMTGGIFGAKYLSNGKEVYIEDTLGAIIDLNSGSDRKVNSEMDIGNDFQFESCGDFSGKSYLKYSK